MSKTDAPFVIVYAVPNRPKLVLGYFPTREAAADRLRQEHYVQINQKWQLPNRQITAIVTDAIPEPPAT